MQGDYDRAEMVCKFCRQKGHNRAHCPSVDNGKSTDFIITKDDVDWALDQLRHAYEHPEEYDLPLGLEVPIWLMRDRKIKS